MRILVTGGGGFLGSTICRMLVAKGHHVRSLARGKYPNLAALGIESIRGDISDRATVTKAAESCDAVFHVAAKAGIWGPRAEYQRINVDGTAAVIDACRSAGVRRLVYTSSPSVVFGNGDMEGVNESVPYPAKYRAHYPQTKGEAERMVLAANDNRLATVALRPHLIWGPGDNHLVPRIVARGKTGQLRRIGRSDKLIDSTFIDNAALAHVLAFESLLPAAAHAGKAYFISNGEPLPLWTLVNRILNAAGVPPVTKVVSPQLAYAAGAILETVYGMFGIKSEPRMTRFLAKELSTAHWFDISAAERDFGYRPLVSIDEGLARLKASFGR